MAQIETQLTATIKFLEDNHNDYLFRLLAVKMVNALHIEELKKLFDYEIIDPRLISKNNQFNKKLNDLIDQLRESDEVLFKCKYKLK